MNPTDWRGARARRSSGPAWRYGSRQRCRASSPGPPRAARISPGGSARSSDLLGQPHLTDVVEDDRNDHDEEDHGERGTQAGVALSEALCVELVGDHRGCLLYTSDAADE